jgi:hypothetical protein
MALVKCPECENDVSDTFSSCPHCGYAKKPDIRSSPLGKSKHGIVSGVIYLLLAAFFAYCFFIVQRDSFFLFGYDLILIVGYGFVRTYQLMFLFSVFFISATVYGVICIIGWHVLLCPYCGKKESIRKFSKSLKCRYCRKASVRNGNFLETVQ